MSSSDSHITRITRTLSSVTSQIFRCHGLMRPKADADDLGIHDLAYWLIFLACLSGWFLFLFAPQRERLGLLESRREILTAHLAAERRELKRLDRSVKDLQRGDTFAWERAARGRMGWVEPGEITDVTTWLPKQASAQPVPQRRNESAQPQPVRMSPAPAGPAPVPSASLRQRFLVTGRDELGPMHSSPPALPRRIVRSTNGRVGITPARNSAVSGGLRLAAR